MEEEKESEHPRGWTPEMLKEMKVRVWSYLEEFEKEKQETMEAITSVLESGNLILGDNVKIFESDFSSYSGCSRGIGVGNCTDAIFIALKAMDIGDGDEVITVSNTAVPTVAAIAMTGAKPRFVDIDPDTYLMNVAELNNVITDKTKAIIPVHLFGQCVDVEKIKDVIGDREIKIIEDCAQAHGASINRKMAGSMGDAGAFSFYPSKVLGTYGDGGMITTNNETFYDRAKSLRMYGMKDKYSSVETGFNSRLDELHAAILQKKFSHIGDYILKRKAIAKRYDEELSNTSLILPKVADSCDHVYYVYVVRHKKRDEIMAKLKEKGILTNISYEWPIHLMPAYEDPIQGKGSLPETEKACNEIFSLPLYPELSNEKQTLVIEALNEILQDIE